MKLRNKKTGEIGELHFIEDKEYHFTVSPENPANMCIYKKLADVSKEWEDYEEPKEYWYIDPMVCGVYYTKIKKDEDLYDFNKQIGNYFGTKEEAEQAVEKLKAWKRLKDKGFRFEWFEEKDRGYIGDMAIYAHIEPDYTTECPELDKDLDLLFGGEE